MVKTRGAKGQFEQVTETQSMEISDILPLPDNSKKWILKLTIYLVILLVMSPWIFIMIRNNSSRQYVQLS